MSVPMTSKATRNATSSQELEDGPSLLDWLAGQTGVKFGPALAPVSHSVPSARKKASMTNGTSGRSGANSSASASLQSSLESRLRARLNGSDICEVTWKPWNTPWGQCLSRPRAQALTIDGIVFGLWPTPRAAKRGPRNPATAAAKLIRDGRSVHHRLEDALTCSENAIGVPSPKFVCWLMGYPQTWLSCAPSGTP